MSELEWTLEINDISLFVLELADHYTDAQRGEAIRLAELTVSFRSRQQGKL